MVLILSVFSMAAVSSTFSSTSIASDYWTHAAPLPKPYYSIYGAATLNGNIYFIGNGIAERYDPETDIWTSIASMPTSNSWPTGGAMVTACENKIYVIGVPDEPTQVYDPATNMWANRSSIPGWLIGRKANVVDNKIYVMGGATFVQGIIFTSAANYVYDPANDLWSVMAPIPLPVEGYASVVLDGKIYLIGEGAETSQPIDANNLVQIITQKPIAGVMEHRFPSALVVPGHVQRQGFWHQRESMLWVGQHVFLVDGCQWMLKIIIRQI